ncbi:MAG: tetratricopeptide repeat protein [Acidobacteriota bacterium]
MSTFAASGAPQKPAEILLEDGIKLTAEGRFADALAVFNRFKQTAPDDPRPYFYSGVALAEAGRLSAAALELSEAVRLNPDHPEYRIFQANVLSRLKQKDHAGSALAVFAKAGTAQQLSTAWLWLLSDVYYRLEKFEQALGILALLGERNPADSQIDLNRGQVYVVISDFDRALESFRKSIEKSSSNPVAHFELGKLLYQRGEIQSSKAALLEAVKQSGSDPNYLHKLGVICLALNEVEEALVYLERAAALGAAPAQVYQALGNAYRRKGDRARAADFMKKFEEVNLARQKKEEREREAERLIAQGEKQIDLGNRAEARSLFEQAVVADPDSWSAHANLAEIFVSANERLAEKHLARMEQLDPDSVVGNYLTAKYWYQRKQFDSARAYAEKVRLVRPGHAELRNLLGNIYVGLGEREKALKEYEAAVRLEPGRADFRENLRTVQK